MIDNFHLRYLGKNILQWEIERNSLFQTNRNDDREIVMRKDEKTMMIPSLKYRLPDNGTGYISIVACSSNGNLIAGFEITRNEIYLWKRNNPVSHFFLHTFASIITMSFGYNDQCLFTLNSKSKITLWDIKDVSIESFFSIRFDFCLLLIKYS